MLLPDARLALIPVEKLRDYVLSPTHPIGRFKAVFFAQLGFTRPAWQDLERALREQHLSASATLVETTAFGRKYRVAAPLTGPAGRTASVVSVWIIPLESPTPRLVTLYPSGE
jgi:hypothetical protein